jgi:hypothetical protein
MLKRAKPPEVTSPSQFKPVDEIMKPLRISVWSGPRNVSTALMYSFAQRRDTRVFDEPLYGHYLRTTGASHPGREEVMAAMECDSERVLAETILGDFDEPVIFFKNMAHHLVDLNWAFLAELTNVLLIRDPREMLPSLVNQLPQPILRDTGLDLQVKMLEFVKRRGQEVPVLDAKFLLLNPAGVLRNLCEQIGIEFQEAMLSWPAGPRREDGIWAKYWYQNLHQSTGFNRYHAKAEPFPPQLGRLLDECLPLYEDLLRNVVTG